MHSLVLLWCAVYLPPFVFYCQELLSTQFYSDIWFLKKKKNYKVYMALVSEEQSSFICQQKEIVITYKKV